MKHSVYNSLLYKHNKKPD